MLILTQMLRAVLFVGLVAGGALAQRPANHGVRFNPSGEYHPFNKPVDDRIIQFHLQVRYKRGRLVAWGRVVGSGVQVYRFKRVSVTPKHLRFSTGRHHGVNYEFEGIFLQQGNFTTALDVPGSFPLQGTLRKFSNGKKVMELTTSFKYYVGC